MKIHEILMSVEELLKPHKRETFAVELIECKQERRYWRKIRETDSAVKNSLLKRMWGGHVEENWALSDRDMRVKLREVDKKMDALYLKRDKYRDNFLSEKAAEYKSEGD